MTWVRTVAVLGMLVAWLPATSHALLEQAHWIHHHNETPDHDHGPANGHDAADGICRVESQMVHVPAPYYDSDLLADSLFAWLGVDLADAVEFSGPSPPGTAPPELISSHHFLLRAALPIRAPSIAP